MGQNSSRGLPGILGRLGLFFSSCSLKGSPFQIIFPCALSMCNLHLVVRVLT